MTEISHPMARKLSLLSQTGASTPMGQLLREFWQPIALSSGIATGKARPIRIFGEDLTIYRGASGKPYLVGHRCAHRLSLLHTGWIEGEQIRCIYHGWKYNGDGMCVERPAEDASRNSSIRIAGYPLREYCGLIFAYLGPGGAPPFELPIKPVFEVPGVTLFPRSETWECNWFQQVENSLDAVHVSFVHRMGIVGSFGAAVSADIPELTYEETSAGIRQIAKRSTNVRVSNWTFPNNNHIVVPGLKTDDPWMDVGIWMVPIDDTHTIRFSIYGLPPTTDEVRDRITRHMDTHADYEPGEHHEALFRGEYPTDPIVQLTSAQDYVATLGQGAIVDRPKEWLGRSDKGVAFLRRLFWRELDLLQQGSPTKKWERLPEAGNLQIMSSSA